MLGDTLKVRNRRHRIKDVPSRGRMWKHSTLGDIDGLVSLQIIEDYFTFTLVRNSWDRMVSYFHWLRKQSFDHAAVSMAKTLGFRDFVIDERTVATNSVNPALAYMVCADGKERCNAYIRIEEFKADAEPLFAHLGFNLSLELLNRSERSRDYRSYYDSETVDVVAACCSEDIARYRYQF